MKRVFIIHGWTYSLDKWTRLCEELNKLEIEPVLLKVPGLTEPSQAAWNIDGYVDWLDKQLAGQTKPTVIGHSNGGRIALAYTQKFPDKFEKLILIDSAGVAHNQPKAKAKLGILRNISKVGKALRLDRIPVLKKVFYKVIGARDYMEAPPNMKTTMQNMLAADATMDFSKVTVATTIIWGRDDTTTPLSDGHTLQSAIKDSKLFIIEAARHSPQATQPAEVARIIKEAIT